MRINKFQGLPFKYFGLLVRNPLLDALQQATNKSYFGIKWEKKLILCKIKHYKNLFTFNNGNN